MHCLQRQTHLDKHTNNGSQITAFTERNQLSTHVLHYWLLLKIHHKTGKDKGAFGGLYRRV